MGALPAACGGSVVVDGDGSGGAGGAGGSTTTTTGTTTGTTTSATCEKDCLQAFASAGVCGALLAQYVQCFIQSPSCDGGGSCQPQLDQFMGCQGGGGGSPGCVTGGCSAGGDGSCSCEGQCNGSPVIADCKPNVNGQLACTCAIGASTIATCTDSSALACDLDFGCCSQFW